MNIQYRSHTFTVPESALIRRESGSVFAAINIGQRGLTFTHYVSVDPRLTDLVYTVPEPPKALTVIMPVSAAEAISHTNVRVLKFTDVSLWHEGLRVA